MNQAAVHAYLTELQNRLVAELAQAGDGPADEEAEMFPFAEVTLQEDLGALMEAMRAFKAQLLAS